jgi:hypothetical protein
MNSESNAIITIILVLVLGFLALIFLGKGNKPTTVTPDSNSVQTTPIAPPLSETKTNEVKPEEVKLQPEPIEPEQVKSGFTGRSMSDLIIVTTPVPYQEIASPLIIEGMARGFWFFEGDFPVMLCDSEGEIIARGQATAKKEWMTEDFVQFSSELKFTPDYGKSGTVIIRNNNPSDMVENNRELRFPIIFSGPDTIAVKVFFSNIKLDPDFSANIAFACQRVIPKTQSVARAAIEELLKGPTEQEKAAGFFTSINTGVKVQKLSILNGVARVDFDKQMEFQVGGSARVGAIRAEVTQTLKQFSTVNEVIITIEGRTEDILQP